MGKEEVLSGLLMELRRGTIVLSVLSQLTEPKYGLQPGDPADGIRPASGDEYALSLTPPSGGTGTLTSEWNTEESKPRKYYCITPEGKGNL